MSEPKREYIVWWEEKMRKNICMKQQQQAIINGERASKGDISASWREARACVCVFFAKSIKQLFTENNAMRQNQNEN